MAQSAAIAWQQKAAAQRITVPWYIWACALAVTSASFGGVWDISWHESIGRNEGRPLASSRAAVSRGRISPSPTAVTTPRAAATVMGIATSCLHRIASTGALVVDYHAVGWSY